MLSRDPARFAREVPQLAARGEFSWLVGDTADFAFPDGSFDYVCHFATASAAEVMRSGIQPDGAGGTARIMHTLRGTERVLQFARASGVKRLLFASSGAVYGRQPADLSHIPEDYRGAPDPTDPASAYGELKRISEVMCASSGIDCVMARGFAFVGPYLPLTDKFAVGSFIRDALAGGPIRIHGDGMAMRSYLYAADLANWLITLLLKGRPGDAYNTGTDVAVSLGELAKQIALHCDPKSSVAIALTGEGSRPDVYVPSIAKARRELGLDASISLASALRKTLSWAGQIPRGIQSGYHVQRSHPG